MSLSTTTGGVGGGGATGGLVMAHQPTGIQQQMPPPPPQAAAGADGIPPSASVLGADLIDKHQQSLSLRQVKSVAHLPLVAIDLYGSGSGTDDSSNACVACFPPKPDDPSVGIPPQTIGKMKSDIYFKSSETAHKTLRKFLNQSKGASYRVLLADSVTKKSDPAAVVLKKPHLWAGIRKIEDNPEFFRTQQQVEDEGSKSAIAEEGSAGPGVVMANSTLDGSIPQGDDFDRVVFKVRLHESKKALTILPEEAVELLLHQARYHVNAIADPNKKSKQNLSEDEQEQEVLEYPCSIALPGWACHDAAVEALLDAANTSDSTGQTSGGGAVLFQRGVCALAGALVRRPDGSSNPLLLRLDRVLQELRKSHDRERIGNPDMVFDDNILVVLFGLTAEGFECTAIQVSARNFSNNMDMSCPFSRFNVRSTISILSDDPLSQMEKCCVDLEEALETIAPDADGPAAIALYGSVADQEKMRTQWESVKKTSNTEWETVPVFTSKLDSVAIGAAVLGAISHGRQCRVVQKNGKARARAELGIQVQNVSPVAVAIQMNYHGGAASKWMPMKTIFDFDRRAPAGPYTLDLVAAECVVHRAAKSELSDEEFLKLTKSHEGARGIPMREEAALNLQIQIFQKWTRDGEWKKVGDPLEPLVKLEPTDDDDEKRVACESVDLEISLGTTGMITTNLVGDRESVVQATRSARNSTILKYTLIGAAVLICGGFLVKSYWDEYTFKRDTNRLLEYYNRVLPGSIADGDERNARYLVWKYRGKRERLWRMLEKKYGIAMPGIGEDWPEDNSMGSEGSEERIDLDDEQDESKGSSTEETDEDYGDETDEL